MFYEVQTELLALENSTQLANIFSKIFSPVFFPKKIIANFFLEKLHSIMTTKNHYQTEVVPIAMKQLLDGKMNYYFNDDIYNNFLNEARFEYTPLLPNNPEEKISEIHFIFSSEEKYVGNLSPIITFLLESYNEVSLNSKVKIQEILSSFIKNLVESANDYHSMSDDFWMILEDIFEKIFGKLPLSSFEAIFSNLKDVWWYDSFDIPNKISVEDVSVLLKHVDWMKLEEKKRVSEFVLYLYSQENEEISEKVFAIHNKINYSVVTQHPAFFAKKIISKDVVKDIFEEISSNISVFSSGIYKFIILLRCISRTEKIHIFSRHLRHREKMLRKEAREKRLKEEVRGILEVCIEMREMDFFFEVFASPLLYGNTIDGEKRNEKKAIGALIDSLNPHSDKIKKYLEFVNSLDESEDITFKKILLCEIGKISSVKNEWGYLSFVLRKIIVC